MTRAELIQLLASKFSQLTLTDAEACVKTILDSISQKLCEGGRVEIRGFGAFTVTYRPPRIGRNPRTGVKVIVPEKHVPHFKAGKELSERVDPD